ncbi:MAG: PNGase F N-terminal domain-containing protein [Nannocystaceae bacterium]
MATRGDRGRAGARRASRHSNALVATRFTEEQRAAQQTLMVGVIVGARCDNYDRIGAVHLALVPKGAASYVPAEVDRIEVARFITPFMDMNESPMTVPYEFAVDDLLPVLPTRRSGPSSTLWFELMILGVPYAANTEIPGCADRNDTQDGTLPLYTDSSREPVVFDALVPLAIEQSFNNYARGASDAIGTTRKTILFEVPAGSQRSQLVLITRTTAPTPAARSTSAAITSSTSTTRWCCSTSPVAPVSRSASTTPRATVSPWPHAQDRRAVVVQQLVPRRRHRHPAHRSRRPRAGAAQLRHRRARRGVRRRSG